MKSSLFGKTVSSPAPAAAKKKAADSSPLASKVKKATSGKKAAAVSAAAPAPAASPDMGEALQALMAQVATLSQELEQAKSQAATVAPVESSGPEWASVPKVEVDLYETKGKNKRSYPALQIWLAGVNPFQADGVSPSRPTLFLKAAEFIRIYEEIILPHGEEIHGECVKHVASFRKAQESSK